MNESLRTKGTKAAINDDITIIMRGWVCVLCGLVAVMDKAGLDAQPQQCQCINQHHHHHRKPFDMFDGIFGWFKEKKSLV